MDRPVGAAEGLERLGRSFGRGPRRLLLAVSGGPDSLALLVLAAECRTRLGVDLAIATVDHGLRPEARDEARAVRHLADRYGLTHRTLPWRPRAVTGNVSGAARDARYRLLAKAARAFGADAIVTAHHQDDQIETHLMAVERGEGARRLAGMRPKRDLEPGLVLLRPFLDVPKSRLEASLRERFIPWALDPTNVDPRFTRTRWRHHVSRIGSGERDRLLNAIGEAARARDDLDREVGVLLGDVRASGAGVVDVRRALFVPSGSGASALLSRILSAAGGSGRPASASSVARLAARLSSEAEVLATLGGCRVMANRDRVCVAREFGRAGPPHLDPDDGACFDERFDLDQTERNFDRLVPLGTLGRGGLRDETLPVALDEGGRPVAAHPTALRRFAPGLRALALSERVSWRLRRDLPAVAGISQIAAKEPSQVGKDFPADYLPFQRMERSEVEAEARPPVAQSQDGR